MDTFDFRSINSNGVTLRLALAGEGPLVIFCHGWPESWYSFRYQLPAFAEAGFRAVAYDVRGYGESSRPLPVAAYSLKNLTADVIGIIDALDYEQAVLIGHDWGGPIALSTAVLYPERIRAVGSLSVPHTVRGSRPAIEHWQTVYKGRYFYQLYFQAEGVAEAELEADLRRSLYLIYCNFDGRGMARLLANKGSGGDVGSHPNSTFLETMHEPDGFPDWFSPADLDYLVSQFAGSGMRGPLNRYRAQTIDWHELPELGKALEQPACFITGALDPVNFFMYSGELNRSRVEKHYRDLRMFEILQGIGHWTQQEQPVAVNTLLLDFLRSVG
ncbi:MAG TPA: alpha/beta hydrolase [Arenicellales bacterium]|nr:alpha/beta hydrolase [Arenicellales bacterium]